MDELLRPLADFSSLSMGTIIRRRGKSKDQQGGYVQTDAEGNIILMNVIDMKKGELLANEGLLRPEDGDGIFMYESSFKSSPRSREALDVVREWTLFKQNGSLQSSILQFVVSAFVPEQVLDWKKGGSLNMIFVPVQQKFRIGRYKERRSPERVCRERFKLWLDSLDVGDHITYVALVTDKKSDVPKFFSCGTRPHVVTESALMETSFNFKPNHGGHIKAVKSAGGRKQFLVDAGSDHLGRGVKTALHTAQKITRALDALYPDFSYTALEGRDAFGKEQSF
ncbi:MAG: hypothetical protein KBA61_05940 [Spirochaetes bacterium]|nr:hypothetical protein [Spirochaetota bacterium]